MRRWWLFGAVAALMIAGLQAGGQAFAAAGAAGAAGQQGPQALLVCNGSTAPCPAGVRPSEACRRPSMPPTRVTGC